MYHGKLTMLRHVAGATPLPNQNRQKLPFPTQIPAAVTPAVKARLRGRKNVALEAGAKECQTREERQ